MRDKNYDAALDSNISSNNGGLSMPPNSPPAKANARGNGSKPTILDNITDQK